jgi:hypothetical protein
MNVALTETVAASYEFEAHLSGQVTATALSSNCQSGTVSRYWPSRTSGVILVALLAAASRVR